MVGTAHSSLSGLGVRFYRFGTPRESTAARANSEAAPLAARYAPFVARSCASPVELHNAFPQERIAMNNPVAWFEIYVQEMPRAKAFYEAVFGIQLSKLENPEIEMWAFPMRQDSFGASGALVRMPGFPSGANSVLVYFSCADCAVEAAKAATAGGRVQKEKMSIGQYGYISLVVDTEGNMIGLHSMQ